MPARLRDSVRVLEEYGIRVEPPSSGSHWKAWNDQVSYRIPARNGLKEEISDVYLGKRAARR